MTTSFLSPTGSTRRSKVGACLRRGPPELILLTVNPKIADRLRADGHEVEPSGRNWSGWHHSLEGLHVLQAVIYVGFAVARLPETLHFEVVHRRDREPGTGAIRNFVDQRWQ
jgi:hypothetical protein